MTSEPGNADRPGDAGRWMRPTILIVGTAVILFMTYFSGVRQAKRMLREKDEARKVAQQNYRVAQRDLIYRLTVAQQLEARRRVGAALQELDRRNFGVAQEHVKTAVELLKTAQSAGTNAPDFTELAATLENINVVGAADVSSAREPLLNAMNQMDAALGEFVPRFLQEKADYDKANPIIPPTMNDVPLPPGNEVMRREN
jgi:uncharacterized tellurite resistance protein B-like protein